MEATPRKRRCGGRFAAQILKGRSNHGKKKRADTDAEEIWHLNESLSVEIAEKFFFFFFDSQTIFSRVLCSAHLTIVDDLVDLCFVEM